MPTPTAPYIAAITMLLAACARAPDMATCKLIGTWEMPPALTSASEKMIRDQGRDPPTVWAETLATLRAKGEIPMTRYEPDGTYVQAGVVLGHGIEDRSTWRIVESAADRIVIGIADKNSPNNECVCTFVFESEDTIREDGGLMNGTKSYRVRTAK